MRKIDYEKSVDDEKLPVTFKYASKKDRAIQEVFLVGTFTSWKDKVAMTKNDEQFVAIVDLPEGEHQYKFVVDGNWEHDPNQASIDDNYNGWNNVVNVKKSDFETKEVVAPALKEEEKPVAPSVDEFVQDVASESEEEELVEKLVEKPVEKPIEELIEEPAKPAAPVLTQVESDEIEQPVENITNNLVDIEPSPVPVFQPESAAEKMDEIEKPEVKPISTTITSFTDFDEFEPAQQPEIQTIGAVEDILEESPVVPEQKQEPVVESVIQALAKEDPAQLFTDFQFAAPLIDGLEEPTHTVEVFDELKKLADLPVIPKSDFELLDTLTSNFAQQIEEEEQKQLVEEEPQRFDFSEQPTDSIEHVQHVQIDSTDGVFEEITIPKETQKDLFETYDAPNSDTECLIADEPVENLVEIIDLTDKAILDEEVNERKPSIVELEDQVHNSSNIDLDHPLDMNSNDKLIKNEVTVHTEQRPGLLEQPFFQRLSSLSLKEKLMVCFGGLVAVFVFAASVFL